MERKKKVVAVDFDGTCVLHIYPKTGRAVPHAITVLKRLIQNNVQLVLFTMRHDKELQAAVYWFKKRNIPIWGINQNPEQVQWTQSPKAYAHLYIDDAAAGCPLIYPKQGRPYVDWKAVEIILEERGFLPRSA